jgi:c-di-GMP-binding flagellar brake protein YcgR
MPLRRGTRVILGYTGENSFWGTMGEVAGFVLDNIPLLEIRNAGSFQRIQRRSNVRISWGNTLQRICVAGEGNIPFEEENLSAAGVGVFTRNPQIPGEILSLQLDMEGEVLQIEGRVVRQVPHQKKGFRVGITFTDLDEIKQERLARYIHRLQLQRQKRRLP